jgi:hypothetical protein
VLCVSLYLLDILGRIEASYEKQHTQRTQPEAPVIRIAAKRFSIAFSVVREGADKLCTDNTRARTSTPRYWYSGS